MARQQKLKVYRTPIGFHDAYVAVPSQKAALEAWGSDANLFARGVAELVTDEALTRDPLDRPGEIIKRMRSAADGDGEPPAARRSRKPVDKPAAEPRKQHSRAAPGRSKAAPRSKPKPKPKPKPSRAALDAAEQAFEDLTRRQDQEERDMRDRQRQLERERQALSQKHDQDREAAEKKIEKARKAHSVALDRWISDQS